jgi:zeaxanthin glucosyltransferase
MKRFLFTVIPEKGHVNPMIGPAMRLQERGHHVAFHAPRDISAQLRAAGLMQLDSGAAPVPPSDLNRGAFFAEKVLDQHWLRGWIKKMLVDEVPDQIEPMRRALRDWQPDVVVTDPMLYAAAIAAALEGVPWVAVSNSLNPVLDAEVKSELLETVRWLSPAREALFARFGIEARFRGCDLLSPWLTIAFTTEEFIGYGVPGVAMVGPSIPPGTRGDETPFSWEKLREDGRIVYMSMGSQIYYQPEFFRKMIRASADLDVQLILSVNELLGSAVLGDLPSHVLTCHYAPQLELLKRVRVLITHGGANSVMEAIYFGVPLLLSPICNDQFHQAHYLRRCGAGRVLDLRTASVQACREVLLELLHSAEIRSAMARLSKSYQRDGASEAAKWIEQMACERA